MKFQGKKGDKQGCLHEGFTVEEIARLEIEDK
jgi:hypothetical protein